MKNVKFETNGNINYKMSDIFVVQMRDFLFINVLMLESSEVKNAN